jgi:hypothetical protein
MTPGGGVAGSVSQRNGNKEKFQTYEEKFE